MLARILMAALLALACAACAPHAPDPRAPQPKRAPAVGLAAASFTVEAPGPHEATLAPPGEAATFPDVDMEPAWRGFGVAGCSYLAPAGAYVDGDGGVDVVFHFHAGQMSERALRASGVRGVFVSCGYGIGSGVYARAFDDPRRFGHVVGHLTRALGEANTRGDVHLRRLALVSWSAGYGAIGRILAVPTWYEATDTVVLLDSLHAPYLQPNPRTPAQGVERVDVKALRRFVRFAEDAARGKKVMAITHSAIVPPDYASTAEATAALLRAVGVAPATVDEENERGMTVSVRADEEGLHVRGFRGRGPRDHFDHLHLVDDALRSWLVPRWYTPRGE